MTAAVPLGPVGFRLAHELEGLLEGVGADHQIVPAEVERIRGWLEASAPYRDVRPFTELRRHLSEILSDGAVTLEECADLLFVVQKFTTVNPHFDAMRSGVQVLSGILAGIAADHQITDTEIAALHQWTESWTHMKGLWPFDECEAIAVNIIASRQREPGLSYLTELISLCPIGGECDPEAISGLARAICAVDPEVIFRDRAFVITGESKKARRAEMVDQIEARGGLVRKTVSAQSHYLVVCDGGSQHWAFSCYGRKIDEAHKLRRAGHPITIAHERDVWDALH